MRLHTFVLTIAMLCTQGVAAAQAPGTSSIGRPRATFTEPFSRVAAVREEPDGRVLVLDDVENLILRVDLQSQSATAVGRPGSGPGEYLLPLSLLPFPADTTLAVDMSGGGRALLIVAQGASSQRLVAAGIPAGTPLFYRPDIQADANGNLYELVMLTSPEDRQEGNSGVRRLDRGSGRQDTIGRVSQLMRSPLSRPVSQRNDGALVTRAGGPPPPFASVDQWAVAPDGRIALVTVEPYRVQFIERSGRRVEGPVLNYSPVPMSAGLKAQWRERQEQPVASLQVGAGGTMSAGQVRRPFQEPSEWPDVLPPFLQRALRFAPDGMLWIERAVPVGAGQMFDVVNTHGHIVRHVELPPGLRLVGFGRSGVFTVRRDEDDLEYLQLHPSTP
jgi:hypothetical protein